MPQSPPSSPAQFNPLEAVAGWLLPGLGHVLIGQKARGLIVMAAILSLWTAGLLIGGIKVIDSQKQLPGWYLAQMLLAPSVALDLYEARGLPQRPPDPSDAKPAYEPSLGRVNEQGVLYTSLAGMLNLLVMIDVLVRSPRTKAQPDGDEQAGEAKTADASESPSSAGNP